MKALLGRKKEMSQFFQPNGDVVPVTIVQAGPCTITQVKTADGKDKYCAYQLAFEDKLKNVAKPQAGHFKKAGVSNKRVMRECRYEGTPTLKVGDVVTVANFTIGDYVDVVGTSKGKGFQGCIRRHNFKSGPRGHGTKNAREPGSVGSNTSPARILPGKRMSGHMGDTRITTRNIKVVAIDPKNNLIYLNGAVPGHNEGDVFIREAITGSRRKGAKGSVKGDPGTIKKK